MLANVLVSNDSYFFFCYCFQDSSKKRSSLRAKITKTKKSCEKLVWHHNYIIDECGLDQGRVNMEMTEMGDWPWLHSGGTCHVHKINCSFLNLRNSQGKRKSWKYIVTPVMQCIVGMKCTNETHVFTHTL